MWMFSCCKSLKNIFVKQREILGGRARKISYNTLHLHQRIHILVIICGYLNKLSIDKIV